MLSNLTHIFYNVHINTNQFYVAIILIIYNCTCTGIIIIMHNCFYYFIYIHGQYWQGKKYANVKDQWVGQTPYIKYHLLKHNFTCSAAPLQKLFSPAYEYKCTCF